MPTQKNRPAASKRFPRKGSAEAPPEPNSVAKQMRSVAGKVLGLGTGAIGAARGLQQASAAARALGGVGTFDAARTALGAVLAKEPASRNGGGYARAGAALRRGREAAGLTLEELSRALDLSDPTLLRALESGKAALPFELILRLASVLGRNDPVGFVMKLTRASNPTLWQSLETLGVGRLLVQSAREREFANIYRARDSARQLSDSDFAAMLAFTKAAFDAAMAFHDNRR